jgi:hypothetical protein
MVLLTACGGGSKKAAATSTTAGTTTTTIPTFTGSASSQYCVLARQFSTAINPNLSGDPKTLFQQFDTFATQFVALVPAPIKADAGTVVSALRQLETAFQAVNYDATKINAAALAPLQSPAFTAATYRIDAYDTQVCGIAPPTT